MRLQIKQKNIRRFASLSALGAGAVTLATGTAEADIVHVTVNQQPTIPTSFISLPGGARFGLSWDVISNRVFTYCPLGCTTGKIAAELHVSFVALALSNVQASGPFSKGERGGAGSVGLVAFHQQKTFFSITPSGLRTRQSSELGTPFVDPDRYFLFRFPDNDKTLYGWGQLDVSRGFPVNQHVTLLDYAYDTTGARILPGQTAPVPEPSETIPLALSALVLGAAGVRRWRASA